MRVTAIFFVSLLIILTAFSAVYQTEEGLASYYADKFEGKPTASGEPYRAAEFTAAHKTLPFGTRLEVRNLSNQKTVEVIVNDRGPFKKGRIVDVSRAAAEALGFVDNGLTRVRITVLE